MRQTFVWDGEHDVSLVFENDSKVKVQLKKVDESGNPLAGAIFLVLKDGQIIDTKTTGADGTVTVPNVSVGYYEFVEAVAPEGFDRDPAPVGIRVDAKDLQGGQTLTVTKVNHRKRALTIEKKDAETGKPVSGAVFHVWGVNVAFEQDVTTGADGKAVLKSMPSGCYEVTETSVPKPYLLDANNRKTVWIEAGQDKDVTLIFKNSTKPGLRLVKTDRETGKPIAGVTFLIQQIGGGYSAQHVTGKDGLIVLDDLTPGAYSVTEVKPAPGYAADAAPRTVWLEQGRTTLLELTNQRKPDLRVLKYDRQSGKPLAGVTFKVWHNSELLGEYTTDSNGEIYLSGLEIGTYLVKETASDGEHVVNSTPQQIELTAGRTETAQLVFFNALKPGIHLIKVDSVTMKPLPNVRFEFKKVGGSYRQEFVTDADGEIDLSKLEPGAYEVRELAALEGYLIDNAVRIVQIGPDETANFIFTNTPKPSLRLIKTSSDGSRLAGVHFRIAKIEDGAHYLDRVTGADGRIVLTGLEPGVYSVTELEAPAGYVKNDAEYHVELAPGKTAQLVVNNEAKPDLKIVKTDAVTGKPVAGVTFMVKKADGSTITTEATDKNGEILLEDLDPGVYEVWERSAPDGYLLNGEHQLITLVPNRLGTVRFQDYPKSELVVKKLDAVTKDPVKGAKFRVTYASNSTFSGELNDLGCFWSDEKGTISLSRLRDGWYRVEEVEPAPGYALADPAVQTVYVKAGATKTVVFENTPLSALVVYKYDLVTGNAVKGAVFQVKYLGGTSGTGGTVIGTYRTSANGSFTVTGLKAGTYVVQEVTSDSGHVIDAAPQTVFISGKEQDVVQLYFGNSPRGALLVKKVDAATGKPLSGVEFFVTDSSGAVVGDGNGKFVTDSSGSFTVGGIAPGTTLMVKETRAKPGYLLDDVPQTAQVKAGQTVALEFRNQPKGNLIVKKVDSVTGKPLAGVEFMITYANGRFVDAAGGTLSSNGLYRTDKNGQIILSGIVGTVVVTETRTLPGYAIDEAARTQTVTVDPNDTQTLVFYNTPAGGVEIVKVSEADRTRRIPGVTFEIRRMDGGLADTVTTDKNGRLYLPLDAGSYYAVEIETAKGFLLDPAPHHFTVKDGQTTALTVTNKPMSGIVIHKVDSATGKGIYGVDFLLYDAKYTPIGQYSSDNEGYVYVEGLTEGGRYYLRELSAPGYVVDTQLKTVYVKAGETTLIEWQNAPATGQLQIAKTSADYNSVNGWPAGSPIPGTVFEVYDRANNLIDTIQTDKNGVAASRPLPLGRYKVVESKAADHYILNRTPMEAEIEFAGQIVRLAMTNKSISTGVSITKTGYAEVMPGQTVRYTFSGIANRSNVSLSSFFWRDTLPVNAVRLDKIVTGTYSAPGWYKVVYKTNLSGGDTYLMYDSLSTQKSYELNASSAALGLAANEYITEFSLVFGTVPAGFHQVEAPKVDCTVLNTVQGGSRFTNTADVGGVYNGQWIQAVTRWTTRVYGRPVVPTLPKTGY